jgi:ABC-type transport system involved in multi-copper enzyme maturation permease subunit
MHKESASTPAVAARANQRRNSKAIALAVPIVVLLMIQWPLRHWVESFSNYVFNLTQVLFGLYTAFAITAASRSNAHLAFVSYGSTKKTKKDSQWRTWARLACVAPWAVLILYTSIPQAWQSILLLEKFREGGFAHGYFMLRLSVVLLALMVVVNALADVYFTRRRQRLSQP